MSCEMPPERCALCVGQDEAGHWLVQDDRGAMEGRFVSFAAALAFARAERHALHGAEVVVSPVPLVARVPFTRLAPEERALPCAA